MTQASLYIAKSLTVINGNVVYMTKLSNLVIEANKYQIIDINGVNKTKKLNKYLELLVNNGYNVISVNYHRINTIADGVSDFSITLSK